jgi:hypothetical protein
MRPSYGLHEWSPLFMVTVDLHELQIFYKNRQGTSVGLKGR